MLSFSIDPVAIGQLVAVAVLPVLVGLVTTRVTAAATKAWLLAGLSLVSSLLAEAIRTWQEGGVYDVGAGLVLALPTFIGAVAMHYGLWKPTGVSTKAQDTGPKHLAAG
ncbi:hypothetical protein [Georgenia faecalis]|uniref:hypothetical protein n=1 Tax=Georgenia faecalis TaxID=2483799 RepID=UPI000FDB2108|nr:hypothetical protein [Georgenia faecalis]